MIAGIIREIEGRRGSQTRLDEGGRYLGIPGDRPFHRIVSDRVDGKTRQSALFTVQETGCDTPGILHTARMLAHPASDA